MLVVVLTSPVLTNISPIFLQGVSNKSKSSKDQDVLSVRQKEFFRNQRCRMERRVGGNRSEEHVHETE